MKFLSQINVNTEYALPIVDGANGQVLTTDGSGAVYWGSVSIGALNLDGLQDVVITTPTSGQILRYGIPVGSGDQNPVWYNWTPNFVTTANAVTITGTQTITGSKTFTAATTMSIASGNDVALTITKGGSHEALYINKTSGSGNAVTIVGTLEATTIVKTGGTSSQFLKADGSVDTNTYLTSYTETQTLDAVTDLGNTTTNAITVGGLTSTSVTTPLIESSGLLIIDADTSGGLQPDQGDPAVPVLSFDWQGSTQGYIDTDGKITFNGFKTPSGTSSQFLKANGTVDSNVYITSAALSGYATQTWVNSNFYNQGQIDDFFYGNEPILGYNKTNWDTAYDWGNHDEAGYLTSFTETDPTVPDHVKAITETQISDWDRAYNWGNHADYGYAPIASPSFTGTPSAPTAAAGTNTTQIATTAFVRTEITNLVDAAPATLDTLNELAAALGDDPNFATTVADSIATKVPQTRTLTINGTALDLSADRSWTIDSADGYVSNVRLVETTLTFEGEGNAFAGGVDLSTLPFAPQGSYLTAEADTLATVTARGNISNTKIQIRTAGNAPGGNIQLGPYSDGASKWAFITAQHYNSSLEPEGFSLIGGLALNGVNAVVIGGNIYESNPATQIQFWTHSSDTHSTGGTQRGVIDSSGNWGIGTTSPAVKLDVNGGIKINGASYLTDNAYFVGSPTYGFRWNSSNDAYNNVIMYDNGNMYVRGNVGIGTTSPAAQLHSGNGTSQQQWIVNQSVAGWYSGIKLARGTGNNSSIGNNNYGLVTTDNGLEFVNFSNISDASGVRYGVIAQGGNWGIGTTSPFGRLNVSRAGINEGAISFDDQANNAHLVLAGTDALVRMQLGTYNNGSYGAWIQASYDNGGVNYGAEPLILNPQGANVGIGTTSPSTKLDVNGVITATGGNSTNWNTAFGWGNNYISDIRLSESNLEFTGEGSAFTGTIDLSGLPFQPAGSYLTAEADTLATVVSRGSTTSSTISVGETTGGGFLFRTNSGWGSWARNGFSFANGSGTPMKSLGAYGDNGTSLGYMYLGTDYQTNTFRIYDNYVYVPGLDLAMSNSNSDHGVGTYFRGDGSHFVLGLRNGNTFYLNYGNDGGALRAYGNLHLATNSARMSTARPDGIAVGGLGWYSDTFYVAGHPDFGPGAGNDVRVYGFGANLYFGNAASGDVARINSSGTFTYGGSEVATRSWVQAQGYLTSETDSQTLDWNQGEKTLTISNGNTVTLDGLVTEDFVTSQGYITGYTETDPVYVSERDSLQLNKTLQPTLLFSTLEDYNKPSGYSTMIQPSSYQNPLPSHGYYHIIARRDTGGGYGALLQSYNTHELYHGNTTQNTSDISWYKIWTSGDFTSTNVTNWNTAYGWGNNYISDVRLSESNLEFTGEGSAFTGTIDLSGLPFQPAGSYLTAEADTLATVTARGSSTTSGITVSGDITVSGVSTGIYFTGGNNRIYFAGARAIEGNGTNLQIGEGHSQTQIQSSTTRVDGILTTAGTSINDSNGARIFGLKSESGKYFTQNAFGQDGGYTWPSTTYVTGNDNSPVGNVTFRGSGAYQGHVGPEYVPIDATKTYKVSVWIRAVSGSPFCYLSHRQYYWDYSNGNPTNGGWGNPYWWSGTPSSSWTEYSMTIGPAGSGADHTHMAGVKFIQHGWLHNYTADGSATAEFQGWKIEELDNTLANNVTVMGNAVVHAGNIGSQSVSYATSSGNSVSTDQTNFSELFIEDAPVATKEYVTSQGYITGSYLPLTGGTLSGNLTFSTQGSKITFGDSTSTNPCMIGEGLVGTEGTDSDFLTIYARSSLRIYSTVTTERARFDINGLTVNGTITEQSSIRYKKDVVGIEFISDRVELLKPVRYKKIENDAEEIGLIAEDVAELFPEVVKYDNEGRPDGVNYSRLSVILLKAVQELTERVNKLENK